MKLHEVITGALNKNPHTLGMLVEYTGKSRSHVWSTLQRMIQTGTAEKLGRGLYQIPQRER